MLTIAGISVMIAYLKGGANDARKAEAEQGRH